MEIWLRRVYDRTEKGPEERVLVDRLWPRGVKKEAIPTWAKQIAPSRELTIGTRTMTRIFRDSGNVMKRNCL